MLYFVCNWMKMRLSEPGRKERSTNFTLRMHWMGGTMFLWHHSVFKRKLRMVCSTLWLQWHVSRKRTRSGSRNWPARQARSSCRQWLQEDTHTRRRCELNKFCLVILVSIVSFAHTLESVCALQPLVTINHSSLSKFVWDLSGYTRKGRLINGRGFKYLSRREGMSMQNHGSSTYHFLRHSNVSHRRYRESMILSIWMTFLLHLT